LGENAHCWDEKATSRSQDRCGKCSYEQSHLFLLAGRTARLGWPMRANLK
jgi:hypothetical protein